jgi:hypothetical protein
MAVMASNHCQSSVRARAAPSIFRGKPQEKKELSKNGMAALAVTFAYSPAPLAHRTGRNAAFFLPSRESFPAQGKLLANFLEKQNE